MSSIIMKEVEENIKKEEIGDGFADDQMIDNLDIKYEDHNYELISGISTAIIKNQSSSHNFSSASLLLGNTYSQQQQQQPPPPPKWGNISSKNFSVKGQTEMVIKKETFKLISGSHNLNNASLPLLSSVSHKMGEGDRPKLVYESRRNSYHNPVIHEDEMSLNEEEETDKKRKAGRPRKSEGNNKVKITILPPPPSILESDRKRKIEQPKKSEGKNKIKITVPSPPSILESDRKRKIERPKKYDDYKIVEPPSRKLDEEKEEENTKVPHENDRHVTMMTEEMGTKRKAGRPRKSDSVKVDKDDDGVDNTLVEKRPKYHQKGLKQYQPQLELEKKEELVEEHQNYYHATTTTTMLIVENKKRKAGRPRKYNDDTEIVDQPPKLDKEGHIEFVNDDSYHHLPDFTEEFNLSRKRGRPRKSDKIGDPEPPQLTLEVVLEDTKLVNERQDYHQDSTPATPMMMMMTEDETAKKRKVGRPRKFDDYNVVKPTRKSEENKSTELILNKSQDFDQTAASAATMMTQELNIKRKIGRPRKSELVSEVGPSPKLAGGGGRDPELKDDQNNCTAADKIEKETIEKQNVDRPRKYHNLKIFRLPQQVTEVKNITLTADKSTVMMTDGMNVKRKVGRPRKPESVTKRKVGRPFKLDKGAKTATTQKVQDKSYYYRAMMARQEFRMKRQVGRPRKYDDYNVAGILGSKGGPEVGTEFSLVDDEIQNYDHAPPKKTMGEGVNMKQKVGRPRKFHRNPPTPPPPGPRIKCPICGLMRKTLSSHVSIVHKQKLYFCNVCPEYFDDRRKLKDHEKETHEIKLPYPCEFCEEQFILKGALINHVNTSHWSRTQFRCTLCPKTFHKLTTLLAHWQGLGLPCSTCGTVIRKKTSANSAALKSTTTTTTSPKRFYCCPVCLAPFQDDHDLTQHLKEEHAETGPASRSYTCPLPECAETFTVMSSWRAHLFEERRKIPCHCESCPELMFSNFKAFKSHILEEHPESIQESSKRSSSSSSNNTSAHARTPTFLHPIVAKNGSNNSDNTCRLCAECQVSVLQYASMADSEYEKFLDSVATMTHGERPFQGDGAGRAVDNNYYYDDDQLFEDVSIENIDMNDIDVTVEVLN